MPKHIEPPTVHAPMRRRGAESSKGESSLKVQSIDSKTNCRDCSATNCRDCSAILHRKSLLNIAKADQPDFLVCATCADTRLQRAMPKVVSITEGMKIAGLTMLYVALAFVLLFLGQDHSPAFQAWQ